jgi:hypothetical protein
MSKRILMPRRFASPLENISLRARDALADCTRRSLPFPA